MKFPNHIAEELEVLQSSLPKSAPGNGFVVDEEYFLSFPLKMLGKLKGENSNPYSVPEAYFETFPPNVLSLIHNERSEAAEELEGLSPLLAGLNKKMPYSVPEGYFHNISPAEIFASEKEDGAIPAYLKKLNAYEVPDNYFEQLPQLIINRVKAEKEEAKVITMQPATSAAFRWKYFAAAAVVTGLLFIGVWFFGKPSSVTMIFQNSVAAGSLEEIPAEELHAYLETFLPLYVEEGAEEVTEEGDFIMNEEDFEIMFTNLSDNDLQAYLNEYVGMVN